MSKDMKYSEVRKIVYKRYRGRCAICGKKLALDEMCISLIVPKSKGGGKDFSNMQAACECCGRMKNNLTNEEFFAKIATVARRHFACTFKEFIKNVLGNSENSEIRKALKEYRNRTAVVKTEIDRADYMSLIDIAIFCDAGDAVDLAFRVGYMNGRNELKEWIMEHYCEKQ